MNVLCGVPQGSILGPILFTLYTNDMYNVSTLLKPILFADDINLFYSGKDDVVAVYAACTYEMQYPS